MTLSNRDIALVVWFGVFVALLIWKPSTRRAVVGVLRAVRGKIAVLLLAYAGYVAAVVAVAWLLGAWNTGLLKDTIAWVVVPGLVLLFGFTKAYEERRFYVRTLVRVIGLTAVVEFYVNLVAFPLWIELLMLPAALFLSLMSAAAGMKRDTEVVGRWADRLLAVAGAAVIVATAASLAARWDALDKSELALAFAQPIWLTLAALPFVFAFSLFANYEAHFVRIEFFAKEDPGAARRAKRALIRTFHVRNRELHRFPGLGIQELARARDWADARRIIAFHRAQARLDDAKKQLKAAELARYAGVKGADWEGRPLDKREFEETKDALAHLAAYHAAQYKEGRYRSDLMEAVTGLVTKAFPEDEITVTVSRNGKSWRAWRRTPGGWHFGIGAAASPPDRWTYEAVGPPESFPQPGTAWKRRGFGEDEE